MPTYDFRCTACETPFEVTRPMSETREECCPRCGAPASRVFTPVGVAFKGTGFHNTDYKARPKEESAAPKTDAPSCPSAGGSACAGCPAAGE